MYYADIGGGSLHCPVACCRRWPCYPARHSCSPLVNTRHCLTRSAGRGAYGQRQLSCACSYFRLPNSVSSDNLGLPLGVHGRSMQGHKAFPKGDRVGAFVPDALLIASSQDALVAHPFQSSPCLSVPEIQELEDGESQRLLSKHEITIRHQLSADAALLTKRPACKERRLPLRRTVTDTAILRYPQRQSLRREIEHAAAETWLITRLTFSLLTYLGLGYRWITKLMALGLYALCLSPGFVQIGYYYFFSKNVHRSITYGENPRNRLDLYLPDGGCKEPKKVVVFITGGAWIIGYKAWGALLAQQLVENDIIVACIDYRNFPQGSMSDMTEDITKGISFVVNNVTHFGGDPKRLYLAGQSAGAHLAAHALVQQAKKEELDGSSLTWRSSQFQAFIGISGGYNLCKLVNHFHTRGLYRSLFVSIVEGEDNLVKFSPDLEVQSPSYRDAVKHLPPMALFHGDADYSIPCDASVSFAESLRSVDADVTFRLYPDKTHTDLILQDPMRGGRDELLDDILTILHVDQLPRGRRRMVPEFLLQMARTISPF